MMRKIIIIIGIIIVIGIGATALFGNTELIDSPNEDISSDIDSDSSRVVTRALIESIGVEAP